MVYSAEIGKVTSTYQVRSEVEWDCCEVICSARMTFHGNGIEQNQVRSEYSMQM